MGGLYTLQMAATGTALMWAASLGHTKICEVLLKVGADSARKDGDGWTALMLAVDRDWYDAAEVLLENGMSDPVS